MKQLVSFLLGNESFHRFVNGTASKSERESWKRWSDKSLEHREAFNQAYHLLGELRFVSAHNPSVDERWKRFYDKFIRGKKGQIPEYPVAVKQSRFIPVLRYAAVFLVASLLAIGYWSISGRPDADSGRTFADVVITTGYREQKTLKFSDGSKIILAPNSRLVHKSNWLKEPVKKMKLKGQAYFNITGKHTKGIAKFEIKTPSGIVRDFGTVFNVSTFNNRTTVVLEQGDLSVTTAGVSRETEQVKLIPGQMATLCPDRNRIDIQTVNPRVYTSWTTKTLYFEHTPLREFINDLKNFYGATIVVRDSTLLSRQLSGGVDRGSLPEMINVVSNVLNVPLSAKNDTIYVGDFLRNQTK